MTDSDMASRWWAHHDAGAEYDAYGEHGGVEMEVRAGVVRVWDGGAHYIAADMIEDLAGACADWAHEMLPDYDPSWPDASRCEVCGVQVQGADDSLPDEAGS